MTDHQSDNSPHQNPSPDRQGDDSSNRHVTKVLHTSNPGEKDSSPEHPSQRKKKPFPVTKFLLILTAAIVLFGGGYQLGKHEESKNHAQAMELPEVTNIFGSGPMGGFGGGQPKEDVDMSLFWNTWKLVEEKFVIREDIDTTNMFYGAIKGMVASLGDPYTFFLTPEENQKSKDDLGGKFEGIGAQLGMRDNLIVVVAPLKNSPAEEAGLRAGDIIIAVDGESTEGWNINQAVSVIRGERGTDVVLRVIRNREQLDITITRDQIKVDSIEASYEEVDGREVAVIKINQFGDTTNTEWNNAINDVERRYRQDEVEALVIDVRGNPGGYLDSAVYIASEFLETGKLVVKQESTVEADREYTVRRRGKMMDIPVVMLIDGGSASASEILSGALRDHDRATVVGMKSFGKGSVQEALDLSGGSGLHVTVAKWILPGGDWIHGKGIEPQIEVENEVEEGNTLTRETDQQLDRAVEEALKLAEE